MSELTTRFIDDTYAEYYNTGKHELAQIYIKSEADKVITHHKYKRCLAMAKICENKFGTVVKPGWWDKWHNRWMELAEKFKPNNSTAQ